MTSAASPSVTRGAAARLATRDFDCIFRDPDRRRRSSHFLVLARPRPAGGVRWGISIKTRLGNAVTRNRIRRRVREALRRTALPGNWDLVVQPRSSEVATRNFAILSRELQELLAAALRGEEER